MLSSHPYILVIILCAGNLIHSERTPITATAPSLYYAFISAGRTIKDVY